MTRAIGLLLQTVSFHGLVITLQSLRQTTTRPSSLPKSQILKIHRKNRTAPELWPQTDQKSLARATSAIGPFADHRPTFNYAFFRAAPLASPQIRSRQSHRLTRALFFEEVREQDSV